jgi:large subunit ribosomal protein L25
MAETKTLAATARSGLGKGASRSTRRAGRVPAVIYGGGDPAQPISLDYREVNRLIYAGHFLTTIYDIDVDGAKQRVIPRDYQLDRIEDRPLHVDFLRLRPGSTLRVAIPVHFVNQDASPGLKKGGALNIVRHTIELKVPADAIPEAVIVDLSELDITESVHISGVTLPPGCRPMDTRHDFTIVTIAAPVALIETVAPTAATTAGAATPEGAAAPPGAPTAPGAAPPAAGPTAPPAPAPEPKGKPKK